LFNLYVPGFYVATYTDTAIPEDKILQLLIIYYWHTELLGFVLTQFQANYTN